MDWFTDLKIEEADDDSVVKRNGTPNVLLQLKLTSSQEITVNMTIKLAASFVAVAILSAVFFTSSNADSMKSIQNAAASSDTTITPLNSPETPRDQVKDLTY